MDGEASGSTITFRPARYPIGGGDANDYGSWYLRFRRFRNRRLSLANVVAGR